MSARVIRFKTTMPFHLESKLVNRYGYAVQQRKPGEYIEFIWSPKPPPSETSNVVQLQTLPQTRQTELMKRCDNIVDFFPDPYNSERAIRTRLHNMSQTLSNAEKQFVLDYMDDNFPVVDKGL